MATEEEITTAAEKLLENLTLCQEAENNNIALTHNEDGSVTVENTATGATNTITSAEAKEILRGRM